MSPERVRSSVRLITQTNCADTCTQKAQRSPGAGKSTQHSSNKCSNNNGRMPFIYTLLAKQVIEDARDGHLAFSVCKCFCLSSLCSSRRLSLTLLSKYSTAELLPDDHFWSSSCKRPLSCLLAQLTKYKFWLAFPENATIQYMQERA